MLSFSGRPGRGRSQSPAKPSALKRTTASRNDWRSRPTTRAASARLAPSKACAIATARKAARRSASPWANRRNSAAPTSSRITKPRAPITFPPPSNRSEGNHTSAKLGITSESAVMTTGITAEDRMRQQRNWHVRRTGVPTATGQQRWDRAYQLLLQWAMTNPPAPAATPAFPIPTEAFHARSDLRPCFDRPSGQSPDH